MEANEPQPYDILWRKIIRHIGAQVRRNVRLRMFAHQPPLCTISSEKGRAIVSYPFFLLLLLHSSSFSTLFVSDASTVSSFSLSSTHSRPHSTLRPVRHPYSPWPNTRSAKTIPSTWGSGKGASASVLSTQEVCRFRLEGAAHPPYSLHRTKPHCPF